MTEFIDDNYLTEESVMDNLKTLVEDEDPISVTYVDGLVVYINMPTLKQQDRGKVISSYPNLKIIQ